MQNNIIIINGPNINLLGDRDKSIYGSETYEDLLNRCKSEASKNNINIDFYQSNIEGEIVTKIQNTQKGQCGRHGECGEPLLGEFHKKNLLCEFCCHFGQQFEERINFRRNAVECRRKK